MLDLQDQYTTNIILFQEKKIDSVWTSYLNEPFLKFDDDIPSPIDQMRPDIVIIKLAEPFILNDYVKPACLPTKPIEAGSACYVSGWGYYIPLTSKELNNASIPKQKSDKLLASRNIISSVEDCEKAAYDSRICINQTHPETLEPICVHLPFLKKYEICTESSNQDACRGDSGGPLICKGKKYEKYIYLVLWCSSLYLNKLSSLYWGSGLSPAKNWA